MLPVLGLVLLLLPILWSGRATTAGGILFIFSVWAGLIAASAIISRRLAEVDPFSEPAEGNEPASKDGGAR